MASQLVIYLLIAVPVRMLLRLVWKAEGLKRDFEKKKETLTMVLFNCQRCYFSSFFVHTVVNVFIVVKHFYNLLGSQLDFLR